MSQNSLGQVYPFSVDINGRSFRQCEMITSKHVFQKPSPVDSPPNNPTQDNDSAARPQTKTNSEKITPNYED